MTTLTQQLADIHVVSILGFAVVMSVIRFGLIKSQSATARAVLELADAILFAAVLMFMVVLPFGVKSFYIPSGSMRETLVDDDHILVNKFVYRVAKPNVADVVVFTAPPLALTLSGEATDPDAAPVDYIKRLIGQPGDTIVVHHGYVTAGTKTLTHHDVRTRLGLENQDTDHLKLVENGCIVTAGPPIQNGTRTAPAERTTVKLTKQELAFKLTGNAGSHITIYPGYVERNGARVPEPYIAEDPGYDLKLVDGMSYKNDCDLGETTLNGTPIYGADITKYDKIPPQPVPSGEYLVMGDNRNDSNDGTCWGPLQANRLIGKAFCIFYPMTRLRIIR